MCVYFDCYVIGWVSGTRVLRTVTDRRSVFGAKTYEILVRSVLFIRTML